MSGAGDSELITVMVYSDDRAVRQEVINALGTRMAPSAPEFDFLEFATEPAAMRRLDEGGVNLAILDGEAAPVGGMGFARQIKDEIDGSPPIVLLIGRPDDAWLATWSRAEAVVQRPLDPVALAHAVGDVLRGVVGAVASAG